MNMRSVAFFVALALAGAGVACMTAPAATDDTAAPEFVAIDRFVPHVSTVPANKGTRVGIFTHEKLTADLEASIARGASLEGRVVLFVHGGSVPSAPDYDLQYKDYSWMEYLAARGFDTFSMDQTGYGLSPRPMMDDPCNMDDENRALATPNPLAGPCQPRYNEGLATTQTDWDEIDSVVEYVRKLRGVERVSLVGWSGGGPRAGGYAARHPEKVEKLVFFAPGYRADSPSEPPAEVPPGVPMRLQTRDTLENGRWGSTVACENQIDPGIQEVIWRTIMGYDPYGSVWGPEGGIMRVRTSRGSWGWNADYAARITAPTLILVGEQDSLVPAGEALHRDLTDTNSVFVKMACATHFAVWETTQYKFMHEASLEWLTTGTFRGQQEGSFSVGVQGAALTE